VDRWLFKISGIPSRKILDFLQACADRSGIDTAPETKSRHAVKHDGSLLGWVYQL
jgi:hypothetical protein